MLLFGLHSISDDWPSDLSDKNWPKCQKRPPKSSKNEMLLFGLHSTSDDWPSDLSDESRLKCKKGPLSHRKMKCSFLDHVQLLMISRVMKVDQNVKKAPLVIKKWNAHFGITLNFWWLAEWSKWWKLTKMWKRCPKSSKNEMLIFGSCSTSDDQLSDESWLKCEKRPPKSSKNEMFVFGWCSTSDDWLSDPSDESWPKCKKGALSHQKMKGSFLDHVQLLMISQAIRVMTVNWNVKKGALSHQKIKCSFLDYIQFLMICRVIWVTKVNQNAKKAP